MGKRRPASYQKESTPEPQQREISQSRANWLKRPVAEVLSKMSTGRPLTPRSTRASHLAERISDRNNSPHTQRFRRCFGNRPAEFDWRLANIRRDYSNTPISRKITGPRTFGAVG